MNAIEIKNVSKCFKLYTDKPLSLKDRMLQFNRKKDYKEFWALKGINFSVRSGEMLALIGKNGSGKSTMLKLLSRIIYPTSGDIILNGRVAGLLELGAGFHPDFSGRENIYINASILGFTEKEIDEKIDDIIEFSEIADFIDTPVRNYSSGMYMRLAFSVAINVRPQIFLIDEILSVGDISFQKKCLKRLEELKASGVTIVLVSHEMSTIEKMCDRAIWIHEGTIREDGDAGSVLQSYQSYMNSI